MFLMFPDKNEDELLNFMKQKLRGLFSASSLNTEKRRKLY